jgi:hypothetical protein
MVGPTASACLLVCASCGSSILKKGLYDLHSKEFRASLSEKHRKKALSALSDEIPLILEPDASSRIASPFVPGSKLQWLPVPELGQVTKNVNKRREFWAVYSQLTDVDITSHTLLEETPFA